MRHVRTQSERHHSELYRIVFLSVYVKCAIVVLFVAFLLQPIAPAYANETVDEGQSSAQEVEEQAPEPEHDPEPEIVEEKESEAVKEDGAAKVSEETEEDIAFESSDSDTEETEEESHDAEENSADAVRDDKMSSTSDETESQTDTSLAETNSDTHEVRSSSTSQDEVETSDNENSSASSQHGEGSDRATSTGDNLDNNGTSTEAVSDQSLQEEGKSTVTDTSTTTGSDIQETVTEEEISDSHTEFVATPGDATDLEQSQKSTSTEATSAIIQSVPTTTKQAVVVMQAPLINEESFYHFGKKDCVSVGDDSFYCSERTGTVSEVKDALYADKDADGDTEIFFTRNGKTTQITHNQLDDSGPYFDALSQTIVWHRLLNDRYQIVEYDLVSGTEHILTSTPANSMEPARYGEQIVWQEWVGSNWEIMLQQGTVTTQLTFSEQHDVSPAIRDGLIMWNSSTQSGDPVLMLYDTRTEEIQTISDVDGVGAHNPRIMLVYESQFSNGDVITKGYDFETKEIVPLAALPTELPQEIPESDQTGETRALIQGKTPSPKEMDTVTKAKNTASSTDIHTDFESSSTTTPIVIDEHDIVIPNATTTPESTVTMSTSTLDVASSTEHIPDLVIPPVATSSDETVG